MNAPQYVTDAEGNRTAVLLDILGYQELLERLEDLEDIAAAHAAGQEEGEALPYDQAMTEVNTERAKLRQDWASASCCAKSIHVPRITTQSLRLARR